MITRARTAKILALGLPIVGGMVSQNLLDLVDTLMVSRLGPAAIAAVGIASFANFLAAAFLIGLGAGVQAVVARRRGEGRLDEMAIPLNGGLFLALVVGLPISLLGVLLAPVLFPPLVGGDAAVVEEGVPYFAARLAGALAIGLNFSFRGYWYGVGDTKTYLAIIVTTHVINVVLSAILIFGWFGLPALGTLGAGLGTTIALYCATVMYLAATLRRARPQGFLARLPRGKTFRSLVRLSIPGAIQTVLFAGALTMLFVIAARVSTDALAIMTVLINLVKFAILPALGFGFAAMTLVSSALGRRDPADAARWGWDVLQMAGMAGLAVAIALAALPETFMGWFLADPSLVALGALALRIQAVALAIDVTATVLSNALTGAGAARTALAVNAGSQWLIGLPLAYVLAIPLGLGVVGLVLGQVVQRVGAAAVFMVLWSAGRWKTIEL